jgi:hypothetical protein
MLSAIVRVRLDKTVEKSGNEVVASLADRSCVTCARGRGHSTLADNVSSYQQVTVPFGKKQRALVLIV